MQTLVKHCRTEFNWFDDDSKLYYPTWEPAPENKSLEKEFKKDDYYAWRYRDSIELKNAPYPGEVTVYKGMWYTCKSIRFYAVTSTSLA